MNLHNGAQCNASSGDGVGMLESLNSAVVTLTGGTGSFGTIMASHLLKEDVSEIRIFSRDENKTEWRRSKSFESSKFLQTFPFKRFTHYKICT